MIIAPCSYVCLLLMKFGVLRQVAPCACIIKPSEYLTAFISQVRGLLRLELLSIGKKIVWCMSWLLRLDEWCPLLGHGSCYALLLEFGTRRFSNRNSSGCVKLKEILSILGLFGFALTMTRGSTCKLLTVSHTQGTLFFLFSYDKTLL